MRWDFPSEYSVGGILVDENMDTGVPGLFAAGECASGVFGANRVADAVTEMLVQGYKAGTVAAERAALEEKVESSRDSVSMITEGIKRRLEQKEDAVWGTLLRKWKAFPIRLWGFGGMKRA